MSIVGSKVQEKVFTKNIRNEGFYQKGDMGGLSFLQSMSDITAIVGNREDTAYVHPTEKRYVSKLNEKSLEICTESLGTETGSESGDELSLLAFEATNIPPMVPLMIPQEEETNSLVKKFTMSRNNSLPPPIKFLKGSKYNRIVRSLGDDGRVVVQAIKVSSPPSCFVSERSEGRLRIRLSLSAESSSLSHNHEDEEEEEEDNKNSERKNGNKKLSMVSSRCKETARDPKPMLTWKKQQLFWVAT